MTESTHSAGHAMLAEQLRRVADVDVVTDACGEIVAAAGTSAEERDAVVAETRLLCEQMRDLATALGDPEDEADLYRSLATLWLELRFVWQRHNMVANYDTIRTGGCAPAVLARASAASYLLQRIEALLDSGHRERLGDTAVELLDALRDEVERANRNLTT